MKRKLTLIYPFLYGLYSDRIRHPHLVRLAQWHVITNSPLREKTNAEKVTHNPRDHLPQPYHGCCSGAARQHTTAMRPSPWLLASEAVLSPAHWSLTVSCSPSHTTNCNNAHAPGRFHLQPYKSSGLPREKQSKFAHVPMQISWKVSVFPSRRQAKDSQRSPHSWVIWVQITDDHTLYSEAAVGHKRKTCRPTLDCHVR